MDAWDRSMLAVSGAEYEIQETLQTMKRLLAAGSLRATTRVVDPPPGLVRVLS